MKVAFKTEELKKILSQLGAVVSKKATSPVYDYVRLTAQPSTEAGIFAVSMTGIDIEARLTRFFSVNTIADQELDVLVSFAKLQYYVGLVSSADVSIEVDGVKAAVVSGKKRAAIQTHTLSDWPDAFERPEKPTATLGLPGLKEQISLTEFAIPQEASKFVVNVSKVESTGEVLRLVATDGVRLAISESKQALDVFTLLLPKTATNHIKKLEGGVSSNTVTILESEAGFYFETEAEILVVTRAGGQFPPYERILPKSAATEAVIEKAPFDEAVKWANGSADVKTPIVKFTATAGALNIAAESTATDNATAGDGLFVNVAGDEINAQVTGPDASFALNGKVLLEFSAVATGPITIKIGNAAQQQPVEFVANGGLYRYLQMPAVKA